MANVNASINIDAPVQDVWDVATDVGRMGEWVSIHREFPESTPTDLVVGTTFKQTLSVAGTPFGVEWTATEVDGPETLAWEGKGPAGATATTRYPQVPERRHPLRLRERVQAPGRQGRRSGGRRRPRPGRARGQGLARRAQADHREPSRPMDRRRLGVTLFLVAAALSFALSIGLWFAGNREEGVFVGLWVPSILAAGAFWITAQASIR